MISRQCVYAMCSIVRRMSMPDASYIGVYPNAVNRGINNTQSDDTTVVDRSVLHAKARAQRRASSFFDALTL